MAEIETKIPALTIDLSKPDPKKHSIRFNAETSTGEEVVSSVYINRLALAKAGLPDPAKIRVTIQPL